MSLTLDKQNAYRQRYAAMTHGWRPATEVYETTIRQHLRGEMRVLDIGCGRGGVFEQLNSAVAYPIGIDPDWQSLHDHRLTDLPRFVALADHLPFQAESLDMILCSWVLEHLPKPTHTFQEIQRVLKPNGYFIFITPNKNSLVAWLNRLLKPLQKYLVPRLYGRDEADTFPVAYRANTTRTLRQLAAHTPLELITLYHIKDPTYFAFRPFLFRLSVGLSRITPAEMAEHLVGIYQKPTI